MVCKPGSVTLLPALATIHLERLLPAASSNLPGHDAGSHLNEQAVPCPYMVLLRMGFTMPVLLPDRRCALTAPFHPYHGTPWRYLFCGTFPRVAPAGRYPASRSCGARTFLSPLSCELGQQSPDHLTAPDYRAQRGMASIWGA